MNVQLSLEKKTPAGAVRRTVAVAERVLSMDPEAMARLRPLPGGLDVFLSTPWGCALSQRLPGARLPALSDASDSTVVRAAALREALKGWLGITNPGSGETTRDLGAGMDMMWVGALPPASGFQLVDWVPAEVLREVYREMAEEHELRGGPAGLAPSLLDQELVEVTSEEEAGGEPTQLVNLTGRMVATVGATGMISPPPAALQEKHPERNLDMVRVAATGSWIRVDGVFGTLYAPRPGGLARLP